jgi:hypothetical protein
MTREKHSTQTNVEFVNESNRISLSAAGTAIASNILKSGSFLGEPIFSSVRIPEWIVQVNLT